MQQHSLRIKSYRSFPKNDNPLSDTAKYRWDKIKTFEMLRAEGASVDIALAAIKMKRPTLYRWRAALREHGPRQFPLWGKKTLTTLLKRDYGREVSESTVGRILAKLIRSSIETGNACGVLSTTLSGGRLISYLLNRHMELHIK